MQKCEKQPECIGSFARLTQGLHEEKAQLGAAEKEIVRIDTEVKNLLRSLGSLTRAIWAVALATFGVLLSFLIWYIQTR